MGLIYGIIIGGISGWLAGQLLKGEGFGILWNIILGVVGGIIGRFLFGLLGFYSHSLIADIISATVGAVILILVVKRLRR